MVNNNLETIIDNNKVIFKKYFDSPRELVFEAWSSPDHAAQWWGPDGFTLTTHNMNFSNGGFWRFTMHGPDGRDYVNTIQFIKIDRPNLILYRHFGEETDAGGIHFQTRISFKEAPGGTNLEIEMEFPSKEELELVAREYGAIEGGQQHLTRLGKYVDSLKLGKKL